MRPSDGARQHRRTLTCVSGEKLQSSFSARRQYTREKVSQWVCSQMQSSMLNNLYQKGRVEVVDWMHFQDSH